MAPSEKKIKSFHLPSSSKVQKRNIFRSRDEEKKRTEEAETAKVYAEFVESFENPQNIVKTFVRGDLTINSEGSSLNASKIYKPTSSFFQQPLSESETKSDTANEDLRENYKKNKEKKKTNLELFKEELVREQEEREKKGKLILTMSSFNSSSTINDSDSTNIFISNIDTSVKESELEAIFCRFGPLASVKILWPRNEEEKLRTKNCGFVAFMSRPDAEKAMHGLNYYDLGGSKINLSWGKTVSLPAVPLLSGEITYDIPTSVKVPNSGLPFNAQVSNHHRDEVTVNNLEKSLVTVTFPSDRNTFCLINRMVEFVLREGALFEAAIMTKELQNPKFKFLFDNFSQDHVYYRWRLFSLLQGDGQFKWSPAQFRMFTTGSVWKPPEPFIIQTQSTAISENVTMGTTSSAKSVTCDSEVLNSKKLSDTQAVKLRKLIWLTTMERVTIAKTMVWCMKHAEYSEQIVSFLRTSLLIPQTSPMKKIARLFVINDILFNCSSNVRQAFSFRKYIEPILPEVMIHLRTVMKGMDSVIQAEKFKLNVVSCLNAWQSWAIYPPQYLIQIQNIFYGFDELLNAEVDIDNDSEHSQDSPHNENIYEDEDLDGIPIDISGPITISKSDHSNYVNSPLNSEEDIDGEPIV